MITHYTDMKGKICPAIKSFAIETTCDTGWCADCELWRNIQKERARELAKEIDNLGEK